MYDLKRKCLFCSYSEVLIPCYFIRNRLEKDAVVSFRIELFSGILNILKLFSNPDHDLVFLKKKWVHHLKHIPKKVQPIPLLEHKNVLSFAFWRLFTFWLLVSDVHVLKILGLLCALKIPSSYDEIVANCCASQLC